MTIKQQLIQELESTSESLLAETLDFLRFLKTKQHKSQVETTSPLFEESSASIDSHDSQEESSSEPSQVPYSPASGRSILRHAGTWSGDDYQECLQLVYTSRGKAKFNYDNDFE
jgi:hypothetical protein